MGMLGLGPASIAQLLETKKKGKRESESMFRHLTTAQFTSPRDLAPSLAQDTNKKISFEWARGGGGGNSSKKKNQ